MIGCCLHKLHFIKCSVRRKTNASLDIYIYGGRKFSNQILGVKFVKDINKEKLFIANVK